MSAAVVFERAIRFNEFMNARRAVPSPEQIMTRFAVSRATAFRWLASYADAKAIVALSPGPYGWDRTSVNDPIPEGPNVFRRRWVDSKTGQELGASA